MFMCDPAKIEVDSFIYGGKQWSEFYFLHSLKKNYNF